MFIKIVLVVRDLIFYTIKEEQEKELRIKNHTREIDEQSRIREIKHSHITQKEVFDKYTKTNCKIS